MNEEMKRVSPFWEEKFGSQVDCMYYEDRLLAIDRTLQECDEILEDVGLGTGFISKRSELEYLFDDKRTLWKYVLALPDFMSYYLDEPFYKALNQHATETISLIKPEDFSVNAGEDNQIGITESYYDPYFGEYKETKTKTTFRFADFLGTGYSEAANNDGWIVTKSGYVEEFAQIFEAQYQGMREIAAEEFEKRGITDYETYIDSFSHQGEFDHRMDKPFLSFVSAVLDITIVKPMIEACIEKDLITGEDLSDLECQFKLVFAAVDMATLGGAIGATRLSEMGMKEALKATGKMVAVEFMGNTAVCGIGAIGQAFDWPAPITIMLSLATGITVSCIGNKLLFKNAEGIVIRETELSDAQVNKIGEMLGETLNPKLEKYVKDSFEGVGKDLQDNFNRYLRENVWCDDTLSNAEKIAIMKANFSKLTAEQKANFNVIADARIIANADYSNWGEWPTINWPDFPGLDSTKEVLGVSSENLKENLDRIGSLSGSNFGVMPEDGHIYTQSERSIAYIDNPEAYHQYTLDTENYFKCIDCIKNNDYKAMNSLIDELNAKNGTNIEHISERCMKDYSLEYLAFQNDEQLKKLCSSKGVDSTYGVMGKAAEWKTASGEIICVGGAEQLNTPISGQILYDLGILK